MNVTKGKLDEVSERYLAAWHALANASGPGTKEYPLEAHASHLLADTLRPKPATEERANADDPVLESFYWRNHGAGYGRADVWVPDRGGTLGTFIEVKLAGLWAGSSRIGQATTSDVLGWWATDVFRLVAGSVPPETPTTCEESEVECAFVIVALGNFKELSRGLESAIATPTSRRGLKKALVRSVGNLSRVEPHQRPAAFMTAASGLVQSFAVPESVRLVHGDAVCTDGYAPGARQRRCVQSMALCWTQTEAPD